MNNVDLKDMFDEEENNFSHQNKRVPPIEDFGKKKPNNNSNPIPMNKPSGFVDNGKKKPPNIKGVKNNQFDVWIKDRWDNTDKLYFLMGLGLFLSGLTLYGIGILSFMGFLFGDITKAPLVFLIIAAIAYILVSIFQVRMIIIVATKTSFNHPLVVKIFTGIAWFAWSGTDIGGIYQGVQSFLINKKTWNFLSAQVAFEINPFWVTVFLIIATLIALGAEIPIALGNKYMKDSYIG
jgi:hypothetical protein